MPVGVKAGTLKNLITWLGKDEDAFLPIALMCVANGTLKPLITMSNPKETPDKKIYAAKREFMNEIVALPVCFAFAHGFKKAGTALLESAIGSGSAKMKLLQTTVFSAAGVISANFVVPTLASALFHPVDKLTQPLIKKFQQSHDSTAKQPVKAQSSVLTPVSLPPVAQPAFGQRPVWSATRYAAPFPPRQASYGGVFR